VQRCGGGTKTLKLYLKQVSKILFLIKAFDATPPAKTKFFFEINLNSESEEIKDNAKSKC
jgi:hypothetical protein